jgi:hypothetical protein
MPSRLLVVLATVATLLGACAHGFLPGTQIRETKANREVYDVVAKALDSFAKRDTAGLLSVISTRYFEDNGTPQPDDDYGYQQLKDKILPDAMNVAKEVFLDAQVQDLVVQGEQAHADVRYRSRARLELPNGSLWDSHRDFDRIRLEKEEGGWKIVGGL